MSQLQVWEQQKDLNNSKIYFLVGRDANLPCVVEHLGTYKVIFISKFRRITKLK